jgi:RND family efflux transporter MFP subunit
MTRYLKLIMGIGSLVLAIGLASLLWATKPEAVKKPPVTSVPTVEVLPIQYGTYTFEIPSQGLVEATRRSRLASEVTGRIVAVSPKFHAGYQVEEGEILLTLEKTDYEAALANAKANLANAEASLASEVARAEQAERDWRKLGSGGEAPDLVKRGPQRRSAEAMAAAATAAVTQAESNLRRTEIRSPYAAVIASTNTDLGSYLTPGAPVAEIFSTAPYQVRLPVSLDEAAFLSSDPAELGKHPVPLSVEVAGVESKWTARILRTEGEINQASRSLYLVAEVSPNSNEGGAPLQPGLFVKAALPSRPIPHLTPVPFAAFLDLRRVAVVDENNLLQFREITVSHRESDLVYVSDGLAEGERVCLTELPGMVEGLRVEPHLKAIGEPLLAPESNDAVEEGIKP